MTFLALGRGTKATAALPSGLTPGGNFAMELIPHQVEKPEDGVVGHNQQGDKDQVAADGGKCQGVAESLSAGQNKRGCKTSRHRGDRELGG